MTSRPRRELFGALMVVALLAGGCGASEAAPSGRDHATLTVLGAASLSRVLPQIGRLFTHEHPGVTLRFSFGGTDLLTAQVEQGARADVFAGASKLYGARLFAERLVGQPRAFCTNRLVLIVPPSDPAGIDSLPDLATKNVRLVIGSPTVPVGAYTRTALKNLDASFGAGYSTKVLSHVVSNELDVESVLTKVRTGEADAGFVYVTDVTATGPAVRSIALPPQAEAVAAYTLAVLDASPHRRLAQALVDLVLSPAGQRILRQAGFGPPPA